MDIEQLRLYALSKTGSEESFPFGETTLVFKVNGKMFLLLSLDAVPVQFNAKADPEEALELREQYACILPGYHMNKKHWNTVIVDGTLTAKQIQQLIDASYALVNGRKKK